MKKSGRPEFDDFADSYEHELNDSIPDLWMQNTYFAAYKIERMALNICNSRSLKILDFGCGVGRSLDLLQKQFPDAELWGFDVSTKSLALAKQRNQKVMLISNIEELPINAFDVVFAANVFHHIGKEDRLDVMRHCKRLLKADGRFFIFEHNPFNPLTNYIFERCIYDQDAAMLKRSETLSLAEKSGLSVIKSEYTLFFPRPLAWLSGLEKFLGWLPLGAQYYVAMEK